MPLPTPTARSPLVVCSVLKCCRQCRWPLSSCSHHWPAYLPNAGIERGGEHGSFMRGDEASSSMKGCSLCMYLRCVRATRASARDMCSTLPARRVDLRGFTSAVVRMYLLCQNASRDSHRVLTGPWRRRVRRDPSSRHGRALAEAAMDGTRVQSAPRHRKGPEKFLPEPLFQA